MAREKERITVTLDKTQKDRLDKLWGDGAEFASRSAVIRHLIDEYDTDSDRRDDLEDSDPREPSVSHRVTLDAHQLVREQAGSLRRLKWRLGGVPSEAYAEAVEQWRDAMDGVDALGSGAVQIDAEFAEVETSPDE